MPNELSKSNTESSRVGIIVLDQNGIIAFVNDNASIFLNKTARDLKGHQFPYTVKKGKKKEITVRHDGGDITHLELSCEDFSEYGNESAIITIKDISEYSNKIEDLQKKVAKLNTSLVYKDIIENISADIHKSLDIQTILDDSVRLIVSRVKRADNALVSLIKGDFAVIKTQKGYPDWFIDRIKKLPRVRSIIWKVLNDGKSVYQSNVSQDKYIGPAGRELGTKSYAAIPLYHDEKVLGVLAVNSYSEDAFTNDEIRLFEDIRKHIEIAIKNSRELNKIKSTKARFDSFMRNMPGAAFIKDQERRHIFVNPGYENSVRLKKEKILDKKAEEVWPQNIAEQITKNDLEVFRSGKSVTVFEDIPMDNNISHWVVNKFPIFVDETVTHLGGIAIDVTNQIKAREKIREQAELLNAAPDSILVTDHEFKIEYFNKKSDELFKISEFYSEGKITLKDILHTKENLEEILEFVKKEGKWSGELTFKNSEDIRRTLQTNLQIVDSENSKSSSVFMTCIDITDQKKVEAQLRQAQRMESIGTLAGGIAHDMNNMLMPISMAVYWLREYKITDESSQDKYHELINMIEEASGRASNLVKQILTFSREFESNYSPVSISSILEDLVSVVKSTFPKNIRIKSDISPGLSDVFGNITQIYQVLMNLCVNARDAIENEGSITISAQQIYIDKKTAGKMIDASEGNYICVSVSDDGVGIPKTNLDKIFDPFFTTKEQGKGTGLGLSICYNIIKEHQGFIKVYSEAGYGTEFMIYIPTNKNTGRYTNKHTLISAEIPKGNGETVLVVDDEESVRTISIMSLSNHGYNVIDAEDGADGIAKYVENKDTVDVAIVDMMMPTLDGPSCIRTLRRINPELKIIGSSGLKEMYKKVVDSSDITLDGELNKPYSTETLLTELHKVLRLELN